jgi:hypothetical protein
MQKTFDNIHKVWALQTIVELATAKSQELGKKNDVDSMLELMLIVSDATKKISNMKWTDSQGLHCGVRIYSRAINNL